MGWVVGDPWEEWVEGGWGWECPKVEVLQVVGVLNFPFHSFYILLHDVDFKPFFSSLNSLFIVGLTTQMILR